ncbi:hypothetical protein H2248_012624 [Termitomyces sp. 'cryptogamus']|nr:hypothetical protein H2248_012624 [Termitomyces sp. 'cryptogamus']
MPAYDRYPHNRPLALDGTIHYPWSILLLTVRNIVQNHDEAKWSNYKTNDSDDEINSDDETDSEDDRNMWHLISIEHLQYNIDVRRVSTRSWVKEKGFDYSKEIEVEDIKRCSKMRSDEEGVLSLAYFPWIINAAIKRRKEIRGPAPDDRGWKEEDRFLAFLWCFARCGKLFTAAI